jgi:hypothetical protein
MKQLQTFAEICEKYSIFGTTKIHLCFKAQKVTASCRISGRNCGASGETFDETMSNLEVQIAAQTGNLCECYKRIADRTVQRIRKFRYKLIKSILYHHREVDLAELQTFVDKVCEYVFSNDKFEFRKNVVSANIRKIKIVNADELCLFLEYCQKDVTELDQYDLFPRIIRQ